MPHQPMTTTPPGKPLRRDAQRNRDALLAAARGAFAEEGLEASLEGIARQAGVAIGTLYRHFPTRIALVEELFAEKFQEWIAAGEQALAMDDAWQGFCSYLEKFCELQARDRAFNDLASMRLPTEALTEQVRDRSYDLACEIFAKAQEQGSLRADATPEDIAFLIWSQARIIQATRTIAPNAWRRHLSLMLDAFRADKALPLAEPPMTPDEVFRAMSTLGGSCTE
ncbi:TetR/AcrR family transcriptional regulator [Kitasatospora sp. NPDC059599]|uniref:TetR/AcrR family transcriptional regulator n=1 Tax=Kitasatospora sp. NPDC059599 TaxID=3346880 RepID=UPI0036A36869